MTEALAGKHILIVEDEYFIASDLKRALEQGSAVVLGPTGDLVRGIALANQEALDGAILDVNLDGDMSFAIADRLGDRDIPYIFLTGYDKWALPEQHRDAPRVSKPFAIRAVLDCLELVIGKPVLAS
jgi:DNA-binding response OmpR family regulator